MYTKRCLYHISHIFLAVVFALNVTRCSNQQTEAYSLEAPGGIVINPLRVFVSPNAKAQGLSGVRPTEFSAKEGALFISKSNQIQSFWMPDTYFNLDIIFLDKDLRVTDIAKNVTHHPGRDGDIPKLSPRYSWHVLEIKANTELSQKIEIGTVFTLNGPRPLEQIKRDIHPEQ